MKRFAFFSIAALCFSLCAQAQSLADVARQERAKHKNVQSTTIITNDTLKANPEEEPPKEAPKSESAAAAKTPASIPATGTAQTPASPTPADSKAHDEKWWRNAFDQARADQKRAEDRVNVLELKMNGLNSDLLSRSDIYNREQVVGDKIQAANKELDDARKEAATARQKIDQLQEDLRRSGGPAGWAR